MRRQRARSRHVARARAYTPGSADPLPGWPVCPFDMYNQSAPRRRAFSPRRAHGISLARALLVYRRASCVRASQARVGEENPFFLHEGARDVRTSNHVGLRRVCEPPVKTPQRTPPKTPRRPRNVKPRPSARRARRARRRGPRRTRRRRPCWAAAPAARRDAEFREGP